MKLCVSNIAWKNYENNEALKILKQNGINAIDISPTNVFGSLDNLDSMKICKEYNYYKENGIKIVGMQSLLYGTPPYSIFDGAFERNCILKHLKKTFFIAEKMNIKNLIFGSPGNRYIKKADKNNLKIAITFFKNISDIAEKYGLNICLEANPKEYGCNFITNSFEAIDFIKKVNKKNFVFNLDTSTVILNNNSLSKVLDYSKEYIKHIHISSPFLKDIKKLKHAEISKLLKSSGYEGYLSLEMKPNLTEDNLKNLEENTKILTKYYK